MKIRAFVGLVGTVCALSACVTTETPKPKPETTTTVSTPRTTPSDLVTDDFLRIGALPAQELELGECGLFLFSGRPSPRFVFFGEAAGAIGKMVLNGEEVLFARTAGDGDVFELQYANQTFKAPALGLEVFINVTPESESSSEGGTKISSGTLRLVREDGWNMVMPVGGAATCSTK